MINESYEVKEGELHRNITIEEYCTNCLEHGKKMKHPEVIASTEV